MKKGIFHTTATILFVTSSLITISATALTPKLVKSSLVFEASQVVVPQKMRGAYSSNRLKGSSRKKFTQRNISKVRLRSKFPRKLGIANYDVLWKVKDLKKRSTRLHRGKVATLHLSPGKYQVTMRIGNYQEKKIIRIRKNRNTVQSFSMKVKAGLLKVASGTSKGAMGNAKIYVRDSRGKVVASSKGRAIKQLLKSGRYTIQVAFSNKSKGRNMVVHVRNGAVKEANLKLPASGKIRLRAFEKGKQPLMKSSSWVIYDASGKAVYKTRKHTIRKNLFPGSYTAKLTVAGKTKTKRFKVSSGQNKTVSLYL